MIKLYFLNINNLKDPKDHPSLLDTVPDWRQKKILRYLKEDDRKRSLGSWLILSKIFEENHVDLEGLYFDPKGKPQSSKIEFNISHSGNIVFGVSSKTRVGCDVEEITKTPFKIMPFIFNDNEISYIKSASSEEEKSRRFYQLWTAKESFLKMTGTGINKHLNNLEIDLDNSLIKEDHITLPHSLLLFSIGNYQFAICLEDDLESNN